MYKFFVLFLVFSESTRGLVIKNEREIGHLDIVYPKPVVCGFGESSWFFVNLEVSSCLTQPCAMSPNYDYEIATLFAPGKLTNNLAFSMKYIPAFGSQVHLALNVRIPGTFSVGKQYRTIHEVYIPKTIAGSTGVMEIWLHDSASGERFINRCFNVNISPSFKELANKLGFKFFDPEITEFFDTVIKASIKDRQEKGEKRNYFIQLMMEAREGKLKLDESELDNFEKDALFKSDTSNIAEDSLDDDGIVSNCVLFIIAGFETTQVSFLFVAYALALNQEIQEKLRTEIEDSLEETDGEFTYDSLHKMTYLDMVINETLRFYPPAPITDRGCTKDYKVPGTDLVIKKGQAISVPTIAIHHDERYYPNPEKFNPLRFSPENNHKINPYTFLAFGQGPRGCIGKRFALTEVKLAIAHLVYNFSIEPSKKTLIPMIYENSPTLKPKGGMFLALKKRTGIEE